MFGEKVHRRVEFASDEWYYDQKLISIRVDEWMRKEGNSKRTFEVSDAGLGRIDRISWHPEQIPPSRFDSFFDAHLILDGFNPEKWATIRPLIRMMFNNDTNGTSSAWQILWCDEYAEKFNRNKLIVGNT